MRTRQTGTNVASDDDHDLATLREDKVGDAAVDYGQLDAKIESIAQLRGLEGARAELALLSLSRAYVRRCVERRGEWTSGIHILWWTKQRLAQVPELRVSDLLRASFVSLSRQVELAQWSIVMLRLTFVSDLGWHVRSDREPVAKLSGILEEAARAVDTVNLKRLVRWAASVAHAQIDKALPEDRYAEIARKLHAQRERTQP